MGYQPLVLEPSSIMDRDIQAAVLVVFVVCPMAMSLVNYYEGNLGFRCGKRTFILNISGMEPECAACPESMYMDEENHTYHSCKRCTIYSTDPDVEITSPCTADRNSVIVKCKDGLYIDHRPNEYGCRPCPLCVNARPDQQECCPNTQNTSTTTSLHPTTTTPTSVTVSNKTEHKTDYVNGSVNVTRQESQPISSGGSQLSIGAIAGIFFACFFVVSIVIVSILYKKCHIDRIRKNRGSATLWDIIMAHCHKIKAKENSNMVPNTDIDLTESV